MIRNRFGTGRITSRRRKPRRAHRQQGIIPLVFWGLGARRAGLPVLAIIIILVLQQSGTILPATGQPPTSEQVATVAYVSDGDTLTAYGANGGHGSNSTKSYAKGDYII